MVEQLLGEFQESIEELTLLPSSGGAFEVEVDGELVYSKKATGRHTEYQEIAELIRSR
jgi:selenoprotein W-related protein